jgi:hypothetical protein
MFQQSLWRLQYTVMHLSHSAQHKRIYTTSICLPTLEDLFKIYILVLIH